MIKVSSCCCADVYYTRGGRIGCNTRCEKCGLICNEKDQKVFKESNINKEVENGS